MPYNFFVNRRSYFFVIIILFFAKASYCAEPKQLGTIVVTPSRIKTTETENHRSITILDREMLYMSDYTAIPDAIGSIGGIDIRRRGPEGVQADINIRGASFEQNSVMIDGIKLNDPQTGHFNMDLPLTAFDLDRIEIMKGPASSVYGANSFGGVINMILKKPSEKELMLNASGGSYDYFSGGVSMSNSFGILKNRFSFEESRSTGYMPETEFSIVSLSDYAVMETGFGNYDFLFGYNKKDFGADSFYSNLFSNEEEHTDTRFFKIGGDINAGSLSVRPKLFLRRHRDKFSLDINKPGWQTNYHTNYNYGGEISLVMENRFMDIACGFELAQDSIDSTSLQTHSRTKDGIYFELSPHLAEDLAVNIGMREDYFSDFKWEYSPSVSASYKIIDGMKVRSSIGRSYRIPTFTDLYYNDSSNIGNANLKPESSWSYEIGADYDKNFFRASITAFRRNSYDTIDWTRSTSADRWRAANIGNVKTNGLELSLNLSPDKLSAEFPVDRVFLEYTMLDSYNKHDYLSKYALDYLKQQICAGVGYKFFGIYNSWILNYKKRVGESGFVITDTKFSKELLRNKKMQFEIFLEISNLFDTDYSEQSGIPMPGRWIKSGGKLTF